MPAEATTPAAIAAAAITLAIDVGATRTRLATVRDGVIASREIHLTHDLLSGSDGIVDRLAAAAAARSSAPGGDGRGTQAVGIAVAAAVGLDGSILVAREFGVPAGSRLKDVVAARTRLPVAIDNDANLAALAETGLGTAGDCSAVAVITIGTNIGLGLVFDGRVHRGARGGAGEAGLMLVPAVDEAGSGPGRWVDAGRFGRGPSFAPAGYAWLEELVGGGALTAAGTEAIHPGLSSAPPRVIGANSLADPRLARLNERAVEGWALLVANLTVVLDLDLVVLTGAVAADANHLLDELRTRVAELVAFPPQIRLGSLGLDAELLGADLLARAALAPRDSDDAGAGLQAQRTGGDR
jgi:glucokinase